MLTMPNREGLSEQGEAALAYARAGLWCFPVHTPNPGGGCSCRNRDCNNVGKHPRTRNGLLDATTNLERIESYWEMWPNANIGIACGPSGLVVVDVDPRHGGDESWRDLVQKVGPDIQETRIAATGGGGSHYIYLCPQNETIGSWANSPKFTGPLGPGIDLRANGGYIVAPGSIHASGALYTWEDERQPIILPYALLERLHGPRGTITAPKLDRTADILAGVPSGERDWTLYRFAARLRAVDVPIDWAYRLVGEAADNCDPPFPAADARKKVDSAYRHKPGVGAFAEPVEEPKHEGGLQGRALLGDLMDLGAPPPTWVVEDVVPAESVILLYGEPGSGKTIVDLSWHATMATAGVHTVFIDEESGANLMARRLSGMGATRQAIDEFFHYYPFPGITVADADALVSFCVELRPALVTFDSLADMLSVSNLDENSASDVTKWMVSVAVRIKHESGASVTLIDHNSKDVTNVRYSRGSGAKKAKVDGAWFVEKTADFDEKTMGSIALRRTKNRAGYLPETVHYAAGGRDNRLIVERSSGSAMSPINIDPNAVRVLRMLDARGAPGAPTGDIISHLDLKPWAWKTLRIELIRAGWVAAEGANKGAVNVITDTGRAVYMGLTSKEHIGDSDINPIYADIPDAGFIGGEGEENPPFRGDSPEPSDKSQGRQFSKKPPKRDWWSFDTDEED